MPALHPANKVIRVDLFASVGPNSRVRDRFFLLYTGTGPTAADLTTLGNTIATAWGANMSPQQHAAYVLQNIELTDLTSSVTPQVIVPTTHGGTRGGTSNPAATAAVIKFKISRRYRGGHPRMYLYAGVAADLNTTTQWLSSFATGLATAFTNFMAAVVSAPPTSMGTLTHVNVNYFKGFSVVTFPSGRAHNVPTQLAVPTTDAVTGYSVNPNIASQRRRNQQSV